MTSCSKRTHQAGHMPDQASLQKILGLGRSVNVTTASDLREPLKNSPIHRLSVYGVSRGEKADATANFGGADGLREVRAEDEAGAVSGRDGAGGAVGRVTGVGGTALSEGRERAASGRTEPHVAGVLSAAVVQPERSGRGGCAV